MTDKEYKILRVNKYDRFLRLTIPKFALEQLKDVKTFMCFMENGCLCYRPIKEDDLKNFAKL